MQTWLSLNRSAQSPLCSVIVAKCSESFKLRHKIPPQETISVHIYPNTFFFLFFFYYHEKQWKKNNFFIIKYSDVYVGLHCTRHYIEVFTEILSFNSYTTYCGRFSYLTDEKIEDRRGGITSPRSLSQ